MALGPDWSVLWVNCTTKQVADESGFYQPTLYHAGDWPNDPCVTREIIVLVQSIPYRNSPPS